MREMAGAVCATTAWPLSDLGLARRTSGRGGPLSAEVGFETSEEAALENAGRSEIGDGSARVAVLGLARSGLAAAKLLLERGCRVELWDLKGPENQARTDQLDECVRAGGHLRLGPHEVSWLDDIDLLVKSPGVDPRIPFVAAARDRGVPLIGELELASLAAVGPIVALTGTNGKSTTTAWVGHMLAASGQSVEVVGNIGRAFSEGVSTSPRSVFVTEVSSFQLEDIQTFRPRVATWLNFSSDHLDRHGRMENYRAAKLRIFENQRDDDIAILGDDPFFDQARVEDLPLGEGLARKTRCLRVRGQDRGEEGGFLRDGRLCLRFGSREMDLGPVGQVALPGPHNLANAMAAAVTAYAAGGEPDAIRSSLTRFPGLPHRLEDVGSVRGVACVNDSKATNTDSLAVALKSFPESVHLIAGGVGKGQDFSRLRSLVESRAAAVYLIGEAARELAGAWPETHSEVFSSLEDAFSAALAGAEVHGTILLSPGCASFDMFRDYEDRGDTFRSLVARFAHEQGA